ncbi:hypothetical protein DYB34_005991 [Aphanomyces astaci]|uniref:Uncharacterized protein n=1 Tax=Aphanomyces astaci TaxID=112090 RepID=A0A418BVI1_APHAT|nr:hypothetical protein DYB34_005991 [Aphanomyces astaci]
MDLRPILKAPTRPDLGAVKAKISASYSSAKQQKEARQICQLEFEESPHTQTKQRLPVDEPIPPTATPASTPSAPAASVSARTPMTVAGLTLPPDFNRFKPVLLNLPAEFLRVRPAPAPTPDNLPSSPVASAPQDARATAPTTATSSRTAASTPSSTQDPSAASQLSKSQRRRHSKQKRKHDSTTKSVRFAIDSDDENETTPSAPTPSTASASAKARHRQKQAALRARAQQKRAQLGLPSLPPLSSSEDESAMPRSGNDSSSDDNRPLVAPKHASRTTSSGASSCRTKAAPPLTLRDQIRQAALSEFENATKDHGGDRGGLDLSSDDSDVGRTTSDDATRLKMHAERQEMLKARAEEKKRQVALEAKLKALHAPEIQAYEDRVARRKAEEATWMANEWAKTVKEREKLEAIELELAKARMAKVEAERMKVEERRRLAEAELEKLMAMRADEERGVVLERDAVTEAIEARRKDMARQMAELEARHQAQLERLKQTPPTCMTAQDTQRSLDLRDHSDASETDQTVHRRGLQASSSRNTPNTNVQTKPTKTKTVPSQRRDAAATSLPVKGALFATRCANGAKRKRLVVAAKQRGKVALKVATTPQPRPRNGKAKVTGWSKAMMAQKESLEAWHQQQQHDLESDDRVDLLDIVHKERERFAALEAAHWARTIGSTPPGPARTPTTMSSKHTSRNHQMSKFHEQIAVPTLASSSSEESSSSSSSSSEESESSDNDDDGGGVADVEPPSKAIVLPPVVEAHDGVPIEALPSSGTANEAPELEPKTPIVADGLDVVDGVVEQAAAADALESNGDVLKVVAVQNHEEPNDKEHNEQSVGSVEKTETGAVELPDEVGAKEGGHLAAMATPSSECSAGVGALEFTRRELEKKQLALEEAKRKFEDELAKVNGGVAASVLAVDLTTSFLAPPPMPKSRPRKSLQNDGVVQKKTPKKRQQPAVVVQRRGRSTESSSSSSSSADDSDWERGAFKPKKKRMGKLARLTRLTARAMANVIEISDDDGAEAQVIVVDDGEARDEEQDEPPTTKVAIPRDWIARLAGHQKGDELELDADGATLI